MKATGLPALAGTQGMLSQAERARATAKEFEEQFLAVMLDQMSEGVGMGEGPGAETYKSMLNEQYAKAFSEAGGIGLADRIADQLIQLQETSPHERRDF